MTTRFRFEIDDAIVIALLGMVGLVEGIQLIESPRIGVGGKVVAAVCAAGLLAVQLIHSARPLRPLRRRVWPVTLPAQLLLCYLPIIGFGWSWLGFGGFALASCVILLPRAVAWTVVVVAGATTAVTTTHLGQPVVDTAYLVLGVLLVTIGVWSLTRLSDAAADLRASRREVARRAVAAEQDRLSQNLSDLLGSRLAAIVGHADRAADLLEAVPAEARVQIAELVTLSRSALEDVRAVAHGERDESLRNQVAMARGLLGAVGVEVSADLAGGPLPRGAEAVLASIVQDAVAGVLGRSRAGHCRIAVGRDDRDVRLVVADDSTARADRAYREESVDGVSAALDAQVAGIGGSIRRGAGADGWFTVTATVPVAR